MILFKHSEELHAYLDKQRNSGKSLGFVPTMGALHRGHISLLAQAGRENDISICSIFINPTQFNDPADYRNYPLTPEQDIEMLVKAGVNVLFMPSVDEIYQPDDGTRNKDYQLGHLEEILEGSFRPGHYQGVCRVVEILLSIVRPTRLYLGRKDFQQCLVITKLVSDLDLQPSPTVEVCDTIRENDGLAMSSRNRRLDHDGRKKAALLPGVLEEIRMGYKENNHDELEQQGIKKLEAAGFRVDYLEIADATTLLPPKPGQQENLVVLVAATINGTRLIDNLLLNEVH